MTGWFVIPGPNNVSVSYTPTLTVTRGTYPEQRCVDEPNK